MLTGRSVIMFEIDGIVILTSHFVIERQFHAACRRLEKVHQDITESLEERNISYDEYHSDMRQCYFLLDLLERMSETSCLT